MFDMKYLRKQVVMIYKQVEMKYLRKKVEIWKYKNMKYLRKQAEMCRGSKIPLCRWFGPVQLTDSQGCKETWEKTNLNISRSCQKDVMMITYYQ